MDTTHTDTTMKTSPWPVAETVRRLLETFAARGVTVFATIDQAAAASDAGLKLRDTVLIIFGNPAGGTPVMDAVPLAALDLPLKLLVWDQSGQTQVSYLTPAVLAERWGVPRELAGPLSAIDVLSDAVLGSTAGG